MWGIISGFLINFFGLITTIVVVAALYRGIKENELFSLFFILTILSVASLVPLFFFFLIVSSLVSTNHLFIYSVIAVLSVVFGTTGSYSLYKTAPYSSLAVKVKASTRFISMAVILSSSCSFLYSISSLFEKINASMNQQLYGILESAPPLSEDLASLVDSLMPKPAISTITSFSLFFIFFNVPFIYFFLKFKEKKTALLLLYILPILIFFSLSEIFGAIEII